MKIKTLFLLISALVAPVAARAQTSTPPVSSGSGQQPPNFTSRLENDPGFKLLSPDEQAWTRQIMERLDKAIANKDLAAIEQIKREAAAHHLAKVNAAATSQPAPAAPKPAPPNNVQAPPAPPATSPCVVAPPKQPGFMDKLKRHAQNTIVKQAAKADARIAKQTGGNLDAGAADATATAINQANQPAPCPPVKGQPAKQ